MASELFPILTTRHLERSLAFYRDLLGGRVTYEFAGPDGAPAYVSVVLGRSSIGIGRDPGAPAWAELEPRPISLWVYVADIDATVDALRSAGAPIDAEPEAQPWGERIARVRDPDGNEVIIGARGDADG